MPKEALFLLLSKKISVALEDRLASAVNLSWLKIK
jgi:hypothetical protein